MASSLVEELMALPYSHPELAHGTHPASPLIQGRYSISWKVGEDVVIDNTKTITATVAWTERGRPKTVDLVATKTIY
jgi:hypothetical protein